MTHNATISGIDTCTHKAYKMSCEDFDGLLERAGHRCEICRRAGVETTHGKLFIDHDRGCGDWAVRGLLCCSCNSRLGMDSAFGNRQDVRQFLADSWYLRYLNDGADEPPFGTVASTPTGHSWIHDEDGWHRVNSQHRKWGRTTWEAIRYANGPHRIQVRTSSAEGPAKIAGRLASRCRQLEAQVEQAARERDEAIRAAEKAGNTQTELVKETGLTRETVRRITNPEIAEAVRKAAAEKRRAAKTKET